MAPLAVDREAVLAFRFRRHQLHRRPGAAATATDVDLLDYGVQDTGSDGSAWALAIRGAPPAGERDLFLAWTLRGAPHAYRRSDAKAVAVATAPLSDADAAKRMFDAVKPLKAAGITALEGLATVAGHLREIVDQPTVKGDVSGALTAAVGDPYLRFCRPCNAIHVYEMPFRLAALQAGLELEAGTSPPVLRRIPRLRPLDFSIAGTEADPAFDVVRNYLRFYGPARARDAAAFLDTSVKEVQAHWPDDVVEVVVDGEQPVKGAPRFALAADHKALTAGRPARSARAIRLVGPYDPYVQLRDRELLVPGAADRKALWPVLGRPGAIVADGDLVGTWRAKTSAKKLTLAIAEWHRLSSDDRDLLEQEAERLAAFRGLTLAAVTTA